MVYKWVWGDGELELASGFAKGVHHYMLLEKIDDELGHVPESYCGGTFSEDPFSGPQFDMCRITWQGQGNPPSSDQIKFMIQQKLQRYADREAMIIERIEQVRIAADVEDTEPEFNFSFLKHPHDDLYPPAFEGTDKITAKAAKALKGHVLKPLADEGYSDADQWIYFTVYGSGISYNWDETGDFDIQMWVDVNKYNESHPKDPMTSDDLVAATRRIVQPVNFPSFKEIGLTTKDKDGGKGDMLIQYYPKPGTGSKEENLASKPYSCYDLETGEWLYHPKPLTPEFYGEHFLSVMQKAEDIAVQAEALLEELQRNTISWQFWTAMIKEQDNPKYQEALDTAKINAEKEKDGVHTLFEGVFGGRAEAYSPEGKGIEDERDVIQKLLEVWGVFQRLKHFARQPLPWEEQEIPKKSMRRVADWSEIMQNAQELRNNGSVQITSNGAQHVEGTVASQESPGVVYNTQFDRMDPNSSAITTWNCTCPWGEVSWGRTRQWKKYEGRPCKHTLAMYWQSLSQPLDEERPENQAQPQQQLFNPADLAPPTAPGGANQPVVGPPTAQPPTAQPPVAQPPAAPSMSQPVPAGQGGTVSIPGALSKLKRSSLPAMKTGAFQNGQVVVSKEPMWGIDRDQNQQMIPVGALGEVLWSDDNESIVIFPTDNGILEPHLVRVQSETENFRPSRARTPFVRRR